MYYSWDGAIDKDECERLIKDGSSLLSKDALIGGKEGKGIQDVKVRCTDISWIPDTRLINRVLLSFVNEANLKYFHYSLDGHQIVQFGAYGKADFYDWHRDSANFNPEDKSIRKLSVMIQLSARDSYEGGDFEFYGGVLKHLKPPISKQGSVLVFNSSDWHRVTPVTKGIRYSLIMWVMGPRFK